MLIAYIDPTTTSTLLYVLIGVAASVGYACRGFFYKMKDMLLASKTGGVFSCGRKSRARLLRRPAVLAGVRACAEGA